MLIPYVSVRELEGRHVCWKSYRLLVAGGRVEKQNRFSSPLFVAMVNDGVVWYWVARAVGIDYFCCSDLG